MTNEKFLEKKIVTNPHVIIDKFSMCRKEDAF